MKHWPIVKILSQEFSSKLSVDCRSQNVLNKAIIDRGIRSRCVLHDELLEIQNISKPDSSTFWYFYAIRDTRDFNVQF